MRTILSIFLITSFFFSSQAQDQEGFINGYHQKEAIILLNGFIKALRVPKLEVSSKACEPYLIEDKVKITPAIFERAHSKGAHFKYPVLFYQVKPIVQNKKYVEYKIWIEKKAGMGITPASIQIIFPTDGSSAKISNINNL